MFKVGCEFMLMAMYSFFQMLKILEIKLSFDMKIILMLY